MAEKNVILTDVANDVRIEDFQLSETADLQLAGSKCWSIRKRTLRGGLSDGIDVVVVNNGELSLSLLPTRGMGLWFGEYHGHRIGWNSPVKLPVHPGFVELTSRNGLGWLSGFNEWMCRCGLSSHGVPGVDVVVDDEGNGSETPLTLHGKIANLPAHFVSVSVSSHGKGTLTVRGVVDETMLFGPCLRLTSSLSTEAGSNRFAIVDEVTNLSSRPDELELLYHTNFGPPFLEAGSRFVAPLREVTPRDARAAQGIDSWTVYEPPTPGYTEQCYFVELEDDEHGETLVLLRNSRGDLGVSLHFQRSELPCFTLWKNTQPEADGYVTGLEPATSLPNFKTFEREQGRVVELAAGETYRSRLEIAIHASANEVEALERQIAILQGNSQPRIHRSPKI